VSFLGGSNGGLRRSKKGPLAEEEFFGAEFLYGVAEFGGFLEFKPS
jgi:hypothetical protein